MAIWILDQYVGELDYPTLGFRASTGDLLSAVAAPDARWSLHSDQAAAETVDRYTVGGDPSYVEPGDGHVLTWSDSANAFVPTARSVFVAEDVDSATAANVNAPASDTRSALDTLIASAVGGLRTLKVAQGQNAPGLGVFDTLAAAAAAAEPGTTITLSPGTHAVPDQVLIAGTDDLVIDMRAATLAVTEDTDKALRLDNCNRVRILGGHIVGPGGTINTTNHGIHINACTNVIIDGVEIEATRCFGIVVSGASDNVHVRNCLVHDTLKDGIHINGGVTNFSVISNSVANTGDDGIAVVSYVTDGNSCENFVVADNLVRGGGARGITVAGGRRGVVSGNQISNMAAAGLMVLRDGTYETFGVSDVTLIGNQIIAPAQTIDNGGIHIGGANVTYPIERIRVLSNSVINAGLHGIYLATSASKQVELKDNIIASPEAAGILANFGTDLSIEGNAVLAPGSQGVNVAGAVTGVLRLNGNTVRDANASNGASSVSFEIHGDLLDAVDCDDNIVVDTVGNSTYPFVFYVCPNVRYGAGNIVKVVGTQKVPAFTSGAIATYRPPSMQSVGTAAPTAGTWDRGAQIWNSTPAAGGAPGWVCTTAGTFGTLDSVTADTTSGSPLVTVSSATGLASGQYITIAGVSGTRQIRSVSGNTVTLTTNADATVAAGAVAYVTPVFKALANLAA